MTNSRLDLRGRVAAAMIVLVFGAAASAQQSLPPIPPIPPARPVEPPASAQVQYQQTVQREKVRDRLQQDQLEQQLRSEVSENAQRPNADNPRAKKQSKHAEQAQYQRDQASQQSLLDSYRRTRPLPRVVPKPLPKPKIDTQHP